MASRTKPSWIGYFMTAAISIAVTAFSFALTQCNTVQSKEAAHRFEGEARQEHRDFRKSIKSNTALIHENVVKILERLPPKP